jgi:hypothetical protein
MNVSIFILSLHYMRLNHKNDFTKRGDASPNYDPIHHPNHNHHVDNKDRPRQLPVVNTVAQHTDADIQVQPHKHPNSKQ